MNKKTVIILAAAMLLSMTAFKVISAQSEATPVTAPTQNAEAKSVAWYVANIKEARNQNQVCYDNPELKNTENCLNALHALQISFKGGN